MTAVDGGGSPIATRFGAVPTVPAPRARDDAERDVLAEARRCGLRAVDWLHGLTATRPDSEAGSALRGLAEAVAVVLVGFEAVLPGLDADRLTLLGRLLDVHAGPEGSLIAHRRGGRLTAEELTAVAALVAVVRGAAGCARDQWPQELPPALALIDHILTSAGAP
ncbi:hypothetical protein [Kitasatospora sp. DSM 101779]|uniref:hypothetical protein n=1 Tax=Kitasatospora sp. DSM 101779 TaxID=2853165 RepID=UPI0021DB2AB5|nr:hypothetical protein [Kitasatospora sp. DSM 101779]MCU7820480.1 hypothetical protein [Kitasatospora sp. DSM 101779]